MTAGIWSATCVLPSLIDPRGARSRPTLSRTDCSTRERAASTRLRPKSRPQKGLRLCYPAGLWVLPRHGGQRFEMRQPPGIIPYEALRQPLSPLFLDYLAGEERAGAFLPRGGFELSSIAAAAARAHGLERPMAAVAEALARQQEGRGSRVAAGRARELAAAGAAAVITGQQAGLFGGPLFVLWKALETVVVARRLEAERSQPVVPVFWVASDDHDFAEVRATTIVDGSGALRTLRYDPQLEPLGRPAWDIALDDTVDGLIDELARALPAALGRDETVELVASCYRAGETVASAFAKLVS